MVNQPDVVVQASVKQELDAVSADERPEKGSGDCEKELLGFAEEEHEVDHNECFGTQVKQRVRAHVQQHVQVGQQLDEAARASEQD